MRPRLFPAAAVAAAFLFGCGETSGRLRGKVVENGQPTGIPAQAALMFTVVDASDKPDAAKSFTATIDKDGTFELVASDGRLPPGKYMVTIETPAGGTSGLAKYKDKYRYPNSPIRAVIAAGQNDLTIDLAKPNG